LLDHVERQKLDLALRDAGQADLPEIHRLKPHCQVAEALGRTSAPRGCALFYSARRCAWRALL
jgi:hypothetical protein